jgi:hypothetical protein
MYPNNDFINYVNETTAAVCFQTEEIKPNDKLTEFNSTNLSINPSLNTNLPLCVQRITRLYPENGLQPLPLQ